MVLTAIYAKVDAIYDDAVDLSAALRGGAPQTTLKELADKLSRDSAAANAASAQYGISVCAE
jgi:hypothetical protein